MTGSEGSNQASPDHAQIAQNFLEATDEISASYRFVGLKDRPQHKLKPATDGGRSSLRPTALNVE